jgi:outer membrane protein TolC
MVKLLALLFAFSLPACAQDSGLTLTRYQKLALENNHELREAAFARESARQTEKGAFTKYFPAVTAAGGIANTDILPGLNTPLSLLPLTGTNNGVTVGALNVSQTLFAGGRVFNSNKLAGVGSNVAELQLEIKRNEIISASEKKFRLMLVLDGKMQTLLAYGKLMDSLYAQVEQANAQGLATKTDLLRVKLKKEEVAVNKTKLADAIEIAGKDMRLYAGMDMDAPLDLREREEKPEQPVYSTATLHARLGERPEFKLLQNGVAAAHLQTKIKTGGYLPSVLVGAAIYRGNYYPNTDFSSSRMNYQDSIAYGLVSIPLSDWWEAAHAIKDMKAKEDSARSRLNSLSDYLVLDMENKLKAFETAYDEVSLAQTGVEEARANTSEMYDGYKNGTEKLSDYLEALALELDAQNKLTEARAAYFQAKTDFLLSTNQLN